MSGTINIQITTTEWTKLSDTSNSGYYENNTGRSILIRESETKPDSNLNTGSIYKTGARGVFENTIGLWGRLIEPSQTEAFAYISITEIDVVNAKLIFRDENITSTTPVETTLIDFKNIGTFTFWIIPILNGGGTAPTSLDVNFEKFLEGYKASGDPTIKTIDEADITTIPDGHVVNVSELKPPSVFEDLKITVTPSENTNIDLLIYLIGA